VARRALITIFHSTGQAEEGLREASILLKSGAADSDTLAAIAHAYMRAGMPDRAVTLCQRALAADPEDAATLSLLAMSAHMAKQHEFGLQVLEGQPPEFAPLVRVLLAIASGKHELARSVGLLAIRNPSVGEVGLAFTARMLCDLGEGETVQRVLRERLPALERDAARLSNERVRIGLGVVYSILGDRRRALEQVRLALEINPGDPWTLYYGGEIHAQLGDERRAIDCLQKAAARGFLSPVYLDWSGGSLYRLREHPEVREWRRSLEAKVAALRKQY
jgi:tetratricopeptide (TPR) repeat protein